MLNGMNICGLDVEATGKRIDALLREAGYTTKEISQLLNISYQSVYKWRTSKGLPELQNLYLLSRILKKSLDDFVVGYEVEKLKIDTRSDDLTLEKENVAKKSSFNLHNSKKIDYFLPACNHIIETNIAEGFTKKNRHLVSYFILFNKVQ